MLPSSPHRHMLNRKRYSGIRQTKGNKTKQKLGKSFLKRCILPKGASESTMSVLPLGDFIFDRIQNDAFYFIILKI